MKPFTFMRSLRNKLLSTLLIIHLLMIGGVTWYFFSCYGDMIGTMKMTSCRKSPTPGRPTKRSRR